jgi:hypothetical protein
MDPSALLISYSLALQQCPKAFAFLLDMIKLTICYVILATRLSREHYLNTEEFIDAVAAELKTKISA